MSRDWIQSFSGTQIFPRDMRRSVFTLEDVAEGISKRCRYTGQCLAFYSVAEHSVLGADLFFEMAYKLPAGERHYRLEQAAAFLLHDVSEAFLPDVPTPLKPFLTVDVGQRNAVESRTWAELEETHVREICNRLGLSLLLDVITSPAVHEMDLAMLQAERAVLHRKPPMPWSVKAEPAKVNIMCLTPEGARNLWLDRFQRYCVPMQDLKEW